MTTSNHLSASELRAKFLDFFEQRGHKVVPSASLIPAETDPTVLFTTAGMHPLVPFLMGENHPAGKRLANLQRCIRTGDIDEVGDESHLTFFVMMGYWSLGDYWKREAIGYIFDFLTKVLKIDSKNFAATCFEGDEENGIARDTEAYDVWRSLGIPEKRIKYLGYDDNWWGPAGTTGPCGPDSELFVWVGEGETPVEFDPENKGWMELCNDVFMAYNAELSSEGLKKSFVGAPLNFPQDFILTELKQKNVDFGMGFERLVLYMNKETDIYKTDIFWPIIEKIERISGKKYQGHKREFRIIADHLRAAVFILSEGVLPSNKGTGYVLRRLIRRAIVNAKSLGINSSFCSSIFDTIYNSDHDINTAKFLDRFRDETRSEMENEELKFRKTLLSGFDLLEIITDKYKNIVENDGFSEDKYKEIAVDIFDLYQSYGFPVELSMEELSKAGIFSNEEQKSIVNEIVESHIKTHQELSRTASAGMFKGGLADSSEETTRLHTAAHLLLASLRRVLGDHVTQKGSNITADRLRFDFSHPDKMTPEQIEKVEQLVNEAIDKKLDVQMEEMSTEEAKKSGAHGVFDDRYGDKVKVYTIIDQSPSEIVSKEICGGPHVSNTSELGHFKITKEESSSAGVRRIKAILE